MPTYTCKVCGKNLSSASSLWTHKRIHNKDKGKSYICQICGASFTQSGTLARHIKSVHKQEHPFKCHPCFLVFKHKEGLNNHLKAHHGDIYCPVCADFYCPNLISFKSHMKTAHPGHSPLTKPTIRIQKVPDGTVSCITHISTSSVTGTVTEVSRITSPKGSAIVVQTTTTSTHTSTSTSTGTSTTPAQLCPLQTTTISQSSGESFSYTENTEGLEPIPSVEELLKQSDPWLCDWQLNDPAPLPSVEELLDNP